MKMTSRWFLLPLALVLAVALAQAGERKLNPYTPGVNGVVGPQVIAETKVAPVHPDAAADKSAMLTLSAVVRQDGTVADVRVLDCDVLDAGFEKAAEEAIRQWRFQPGTWNGRAVDTVQKLRLRIGASDDPVASGGDEARAVLPVAGGPGVPALLGGMVERVGAMNAGFPGYPGGRLPPAVGQAAKPQPTPRARCEPGSGDCLYAKPQQASPRAVTPLPPPTAR